MPSNTSPRSSVSIEGVSPPPIDPPSPVEDELDSSDDEHEVKKKLLQTLKRMPNPHPGVMRYHGKSSNLMFLQSVLMQRYPGNDRPKTAEGVLGLRQYMRDTPADYPASVLLPCC